MKRINATYKALQHLPIDIVEIILDYSDPYNILAFKIGLQKSLNNRLFVDWDPMGDHFNYYWSCYRDHLVAFLLSEIRKSYYHKRVRRHKKTMILPKAQDLACDESIQFMLRQYSRQYVQNSCF